MIALVQRVQRAEVRVDEKLLSQINSGICIFLGICDTDSDEDTTYLINRITSLKWFKDGVGKFVHNLKNYQATTSGEVPEILVVSQFTLYADLKKGTKPSFTRAMEPTSANKMYEDFCNKLATLGYTVNRGKFGAYMAVELINDGPATFILSSDHLQHHDRNKI